MSRMLLASRKGSRVAIRWRDNAIVSYKGERFVTEPKESREQVLATSVNLSWIKRKRKSGPGGGKIS